MLFETRCAGCDQPGPAICTTCRFALLAPPPTGVDDQVVAALAFTGRARRIVLGMKYRNRRAVGRHLAGLLVNRLVADGVHRQVDVVTWAPTTPSRRRERGFDQSELVARAVARQLGLPCRRLLDRRGGSVAQTGRTRSDRLNAPVFLARPGIDGRRVMVVDDVVTTGATLAGAALALEARGAVVACRATVAATPRRSAATSVSSAPAVALRPDGVAA